MRGVRRAAMRARHRPIVAAEDVFARTLLAFHPGFPYRKRLYESARTLSTWRKNTPQAKAAALARVLATTATEES